jgi:hypothetical protein
MFFIRARSTGSRRNATCQKLLHPKLLHPKFEHHWGMGCFSRSGDRETLPPFSLGRNQSRTLLAGLTHHLQAGDAQIGVLLFARCLDHSFSLLFCFLLCLGLMGARTSLTEMIILGQPPLSTGLRSVRGTFLATFAQRYRTSTGTTRFRHCLGKSSAWAFNNSGGLNATYWRNQERANFPGRNGT